MVVLCTEVQSIRGTILLKNWLLICHSIYVVASEFRKDISTHDGCATFYEL